MEYFTGGNISELRSQMITFIHLYQMESFTWNVFRMATTLSAWQKMDIF